MHDTPPPYPPAPWATEPAPLAGGDAQAVALRVAAALSLVVATGLGLLGAHWYTSRAADGPEEALAEIEDGHLLALTSGGVASEEDQAVLEVSGPTAGEIVLVNGDSVGTTPTRVYLDAMGEQWVVIVRDGETILDTTLWVWSGDVATLTSGPPKEPSAEAAVITRPEPPPATSSPGTIRVASTPSGAGVLLNGRRVGETPLTVDGLTPGRYTLLIQRSGYEPVQRRVTVRPGTLYEADLALRANEPRPDPIRPSSPPPETEPPPRPEPTVRARPEATAPMGTIEVYVHPRGQIEINGRVRRPESDAVYRTDLPVGTHQIRVSHPSLGSQERLVIVDRGVTYRLDFTLGADL